MKKTEIKLELEPFVLPGMKEERPLIIAGPCSAESEEQVMQTAEALKEAGVQIFRAGIWKPRTHPDTFEGVGSKGLKWLERVRKELGMLVTIEVANVKHVYQALRYGIDILWVGARTTANPFAIQEIADALEGTEVPVMVKNPVNPDLELWIGAFERLNRAGIRKLAAIHRGFSHFGFNHFRNEPQWQIPIELRRQVPELPIITDPSHICGCRGLIYEISQRAMDLRFDGLIIESHIDPANAWSDKEQQITPAGLKSLLAKLILRKEDSHDQEYQAELEELRRQIDQMDNEIINTLGQRMKVSVKIGQLKKKQNVAILQPGRWQEILDTMKQKGAERGIGEETIEKIFMAIHQESINHQNQVMKE